MEVSVAGKKAKQAMLKAHLQKPKGPVGRYSELYFFNPTEQKIKSIPREPTELRNTKQVRANLFPMKQASLQSGAG